jgi:hypothetical protein
MSIENLMQLGFAGGIATYLVYWITKKQDQKIDKIVDALECIVEALGVKRK